MNKTKKNIVLVGFSYAERNSIGAPEIGKVIILDKLEDAKKHQGYLLVVNNKDNIPMVELDKKYRKHFNKYTRVWLYNEKYKTYIDKYSNIELVYNYIFNGICLWLWDEWELYKEKLEHENTSSSYTKKRLENIEKLHTYLRNYKTIKTNKICEDLRINARMVQRYMKDINDIYHNIGYDYSNNEWYIVW